jgi:hypothetical protein
VNTKAAAKPDEAAKPEDAGGAGAKPEKMPAPPIDPSRLRNLAEVAGDAYQLVLPRGVDPHEVIANPAVYLMRLPVEKLAVGGRLELTDDDDLFLIELRIRALHGSRAMGLRFARFHARVLYDERDSAVLQDVQSSGEWQVRYMGRHLLWRAVRPNGSVVDTAFNDEGACKAYVRQQQANPLAR